MSKPQIVLVHGAWHNPAAFAPLTSRLEPLGYTIHVPDLPSVGSSSPPEDFSQDIAALRAVVDTAIGTGNDVVVICHSWGGMVGGSALVGYSKSEREAEGKTGGVVRCGYLAAFMAPVGVSLLDLTGGQYMPWYDVKVSDNSVAALG